MSAMEFLVGENYRIDLDGSVARCAVLRRRDLDPEVGARLAEELVQTFARLAAGRAYGMILDVRDAPPANGPRTQGAIGRMLGAFEAAGRPIALLVTDSPVQSMQLARLVREHAPTQGRMFTAPAETEAWVRSCLERTTVGRARP
jgi:hypothetical protein